jgi:peptide/nickel transport system permease protein
MGLDHVFDRVIGRPARAMPGTAGPSSTSTETAASSAPDKGGLSFTLKFLIADRPALAGMALVVVFLGWAVVEGIMQELATYLKAPAYGWTLLPSDPLSLNFNSKLLPPSLKDFPNLIFGTNYQGQSIFSRLMYATPHDAIACVTVVGSAIVIGMLLGTAAGYIGGWTDEILMRVTDAFLALPPIVLAITVSVLLGAGFYALLIALIIVWWPTYARIFRGQALTVRNKAYIEASKMSGAGPFRILIKHVFPNSVDPIIAIATLDFGNVILTYAVLAFLGIGATFNYPEWGAESSSGLGFFPGDWWWAVIPGLVILVVVIAFTLLGDRVQDLVGGRITY